MHALCITKTKLVHNYVHTYLVINESGAVMQHSE
jgi:hypothetical protein